MDEKVLDLPASLRIIQQKINEVYPFNIYLEVNKKEPKNSFVMTIAKKSFKKYEKQITQEICDYFHNDFKVRADLILKKKENPLFGSDVKLYFQIKIN